MKKYTRSILIAILIFVLSLFNFSEIQDEDVSFFPHFDKVIHFLMYFTLAFVLFLDLRKAKLAKNYFFWGLLFSIVYGILMEVFQLVFTTCRSFEFADILINASGAIVSLFVFRLFLKSKKAFF